MVKKAVFAVIAVMIGTLLAFFAAELGLRLYLFGPKLHFQDNRVVDRGLFGADKKHMFFTGDSFTQGYPFPIDWSYPVILEKKMNDGNIKITNFALRSSGLYDQANIIDQVSALGPSFIVWGLSTNDVYIAAGERKDLGRLYSCSLMSFPDKMTRANYFAAVYALACDCLFRARMGLFCTIKEVLNTYSYLYVFVKEKIKHGAQFSVNEPAGIDTGLLERYSVNARPEGVFEPVFEAVLHVKNSLDSKNIKLILCFVPQETDLNQILFEKTIAAYNKNIDVYYRYNIRDSLREFCLKNGIAFIDPSGYLEERLKQGAPVFIKLDRHYTRAGNEDMAEFLSEALPSEIK